MTKQSRKSSSCASETLKQIGEDELVRHIRSWMKETSVRRGAQRRIPVWARFRVEVGIGDDTAIVRTAPGAPPLALTTDMLVEGVHFFSDHPPEDLGGKAVASNLSDLAAVGAWPAWIVVSLGAPATTSVEWVEALYRGIRSALIPFGCACIGGDCVRAARIAINIAAGGNCAPDSNRPLRNRARPGQSLYATGTLGDSGAGFALLRDPHRFKTIGLDQSVVRALVEQHRRPTPRVEAGIAIARHCSDAAMMDLSDGLATDLPRLAEASSCGFVVQLASLPLSRALKRFAQSASRPPESFALFGGEDYELLFATAEPPEKWRDRVAHAGGSKPLRIARIGCAVEGEGIRYVDRDGRDVVPHDLGFRHF